jgi:hypothetical protein
VRYFADAGPRSGPLLRDTTPGTIGVLEAPEKPMPVGVAQCVGWDESGRALSLWQLNVYDTDASLLWVVVDREFVPVR